jgi:hypothetical protein
MALGHGMLVPNGLSFRKKQPCIIIIGFLSTRHKLWFEDVNKAKKMACYGTQSILSFAALSDRTQ